jgi:hypothetical protein
MPRWLLAVLAVALLLLLAVAARPLLFPPTNARLTEENCRRIQPGMRLKEVVAILGPPGDYRTRPTRPAGRAGFAFIVSSSVPQWQDIYRHWEALWQGDNVDIRARVETDGEVTGGICVPVDPEPVGLFELLRWRWERW